MGFPWEREYDQPCDRNEMGMGIRRMGKGIKTWEWETIKLLQNFCAQYEMYNFTCYTSIANITWLSYFKVKSLKWEGFGTRNMFPHISNMNACGTIRSVKKVSLAWIRVNRFVQYRVSTQHRQCLLQYTPSLVVRPLHATI